jgi:HSP20 family molecular chaperone IbpA
MAAAKDLEVQQKRPVQSSEESTVPANMFLPTTDIFETDDELRVLVEMPGVEKGNVDISVKDRILTIDGRIDFQKYAGMTPVYTEYNIGNFHRRFSLSNKVDASSIRAEMGDGLLILTIPKSEEAKAQKIEIS